MDTDRAMDTARRTEAWVTADEWFSGGRRIWYDPASAQAPGDDEPPESRARYGSSNA